MRQNTFFQMFVLCFYFNSNNIPWADILPVFINYNTFNHRGNRIIAILFHHKFQILHRIHFIAIKSIIFSGFRIYFYRRYLPCSRISLFRNCIHAHCLLCIRIIICCNPFSIIALPTLYIYSNPPDIFVIAGNIDRICYCFTHSQLSIPVCIIYLHLDIGNGNMSIYIPSYFKLIQLFPVLIYYLPFRVIPNFILYPNPGNIKAVSYKFATRKGSGIQISVSFFYTI